MAGFPWRLAGLGAIVLSGMATIAIIAEEPRYVPTAISEAERADLQAYLDEFDVPLRDWSDGRVDGRGVSLGYGVTGNVDADTTVIFIPGIRGQAEFFTGFINEWYDRGYRVAVLDLPGQGRSDRRSPNREKPFSEDFFKLGDIVADGLSNLVAELGATTVIAVGDSYGGHVLLRAAHDHDLPVDHVVGMVPALGLFSGETPGWILTGLPRAIQTIGLGHKYGPVGANWVMEAYDPTDDTICQTRPDRIRLQQAYFGLNPELRVGGITWGWMAGLDRSGSKLVASGAIDEPLTIITAGKDYIVDNVRAKALCDKADGGCTYVDLPDAKHCLILESDASINALLDHVDAAIARSR